MNGNDAGGAYQEALDFLYSLINLEQNRLDRYAASKLDVSRPRQLLALLGEPQRQFPAIHIAGTKGKGSVSAICAACLRAAGLKVGLYTSPHLRDFRERIRILTPEDGDGCIPEGDFVDLMAEMRVALTQLPEATWFEVVTALAFRHFARQAVDVAVVEVGLGGRLDATNVITPLVSVITSLSLDHTDLLGDTLVDIAYEKGGIIKPGVPVVVAPQQPEALERLLSIAMERKAPVTVVGRDWLYEGEACGSGQKLALVQTPPSAFISPSVFDLSLAGVHQLENATVALAALDVAQPFFAGLTPAAVRQGLATVEWPGRLQIVHQAENTPALLVDCAHNPDSAAKLGYALRHDYDYGRLWLIFGAPADKNITGMVEELFPLAEATIVTRADHPRAAEPGEVAALAASLGYEAITAPTVAEALTTAWQLAQPGDLICVTGSIILVGDLLNQWESLQWQLLESDALRDDVDLK